jgi:hypothetical protein
MSTQEKTSKIPYVTSPEEIKVLIKNALQKENIGTIHQITLKEGPRTYKYATILEIIDPATKDTHHITLKLDSVDRFKAGWFGKPEKSISLSSENENEIARLRDFLTAELSGKLKRNEEELHIISGEEFSKLQKILDCLPDLNPSDKIQLVKTILQNIKSSDIDTEKLTLIFNDSSTELIKSIAIAAKLLDYRKSYNDLFYMVKNNESSEAKIQKLLEANPWMFGSEYSELLERRKWTRDENLDFMLRRSSDGFLEIIEIKTPSSDKLFVHDKSHDCYYPSAKLSNVIGQVIKYIENIDRDRDSIKSKDNYDPLKIRAKIIFGRDDSGECQDALRLLNSHLHRVEIITFDQLMKIAERVLNVFGKNASTSEMDSSEDDLPF